MCPRATHTLSGQNSVKNIFRKKKAAFPREMVDRPTQRKNKMLYNVTMVEGNVQGMKGQSEGMAAN